MKTKDQAIQAIKNNPDLFFLTADGVNYFEFEPSYRNLNDCDEKGLCYVFYESLTIEDVEAMEEDKKYQKKLLIKYARDEIRTVLLEQIILHNGQSRDWNLSLRPGYADPINLITTNRGIQCKSEKDSRKFMYLVRNAEDWPGVIDGEPCIIH